MSDYTPFPVWPAPSPGGGVSSHGALTGRSSADQHPIGAITGLEAALASAGGGGGGAPVFARVHPSNAPDFATADTIITAAFGGLYDVEPFAEGSVLDPANLRLVLPAEEQLGNTYAIAYPLSGVLSDDARDEVIYGARATSSVPVPADAAVIVMLADAGGILPGKVGVSDSDTDAFVAIDSPILPGSALGSAGETVLLNEPIRTATAAADTYVIVTFNYNPAAPNSEPLEWEGAVELLTVHGYPLSLGGDGVTQAIGFAVDDQADALDLNGTAPPFPPFPTLIHARSDGSEDGVYDIVDDAWVKRDTQPDQFIAIQTIDAAGDPLHGFAALFVPDPTVGGWGALTWMLSSPEFPASTFTYVTDGAGGYQLVGGPYVEGSARIFIGPDDPDGAGFTLNDGDQWEQTA